MNHTLAALYNPALPSSLGGSSSTGGGAIIGNLIGSIIGLVLILAFCLAFAFFLTGGIQWLTSGGDKTALENARNKITNAIIGLIIVAAAYAVFMLVGQFFGISTSTTGIEIKIPSLNNSSSSDLTPAQNYHYQSNTP